jgi:hypothetical protein
MWKLGRHHARRNHGRADVMRLEPTRSNFFQVVWTSASTSLRLVTSPLYGRVVLSPKPLLAPEMATILPAMTAVAMA